MDLAGLITLGLAVCGVYISTIIVSRKFTEATYRVKVLLERTISTNVYRIRVVNKSIQPITVVDITLGNEILLFVKTEKKSNWIADIRLYNGLFPVTLKGSESLVINLSDQISKRMCGFYSPQVAVYDSEGHKHWGMLKKVTNNSETGVFSSLLLADIGDLLTYFLIKDI